jgi:hypothetical protein
MKRRNILSLPISIALTTCAGNLTISQAVEDVALIADGFLGVLPNIVGIAGLSTDDLTQAAGWIADLHTLAVRLGAATTAAEAAPIVRQVQGTLGRLAGILAFFPVPAPVVLALQMAQALVPLVYAAFNVPQPQAPNRALARFTSPSVTPDQARATLKQLATRSHNASDEVR